MLASPSAHPLTWPWRLVLAAAATGSVFLLQLAVLPRPSIAPFVFFYAAVVVSAWLGGASGATFTILLSAALVNHEFMSPVGIWSTSGPALTATVLYVAGSSIVALLCMMFRRTEAELRSARDRAEQLARFPEENPDPVLRLSRSLELVYANRAACAMLGVLHPAVGAAVPEALAEHVRGALAEGRRLQRETRFGDRVFSLTLSPTDSDVNVYAQDVTRRRRAEDELRASEEQLREADRRKDEFLAMLAHELRNPLTPIVNATELIAKRAVDPSIAPLAAMIARQTTRMTKLVDDLLDVSRVTRGQIVLQREPVDVRAIVDAAVEATSPLFASQKHEVTVTHPGEPMVVDADPARLEQVCVNLLNNAAKYTERGGHVSVTTERVDGTARIRVRDTGMGIRADLLPHVFDIFTQGERTLDRSAGGLGIGLAVVRRLVEMHGGTVEAHSEGAGAGAELVVSLPISRSVHVQPREGLAEHGPSVGLAGGRVLLVEDNPDVALTLVALIRSWGLDVRHAPDGSDAVRTIGEYHPDLVLLDIGLPGADGYEVARRIRAGSLRVPIVAVTGYGQERDRRRSREAGIDEHLVKPVDPAVLRGVAERYLRAEPPRA